MKRLNLLHFFIVFAAFVSVPVGGLKAQDSLSANYTDISKVIFVKPMSKFVKSCIIRRTDNIESIFSQLKFKDGTTYPGVIPTKMVTSKVVLRFDVNNSADTAHMISFFPGFYYNHIQLYFLEGNGLKKIPQMLPDNPDSIGFRLFSLGANDSATIIAELTPIKTYINSIRPRLINASQTGIFISSLRSDHNKIQLVTYVFCGLLLMMILFSLANFLQGANREFFYYSGYAFLMGGMLFTKALLDYHASYVSFFIESYLDFIMQCLGIMFYMIFMQKFLETKQKHPFLYKLYNVGILLLALAMLTFTFLHYFTDNFSLQNMVENATKVLLLLMVVIFLMYSMRHWKDKLLRYLFWGNLLLFFFSLISQIAVMQQSFFKNLPGILSSALFYYEMGLFLELVLFLMGLNYKNRRRLIAQTKEREALKAQNQLQEIEKELAVLKAQQQERERISADMHDELGAGMTAIRLMSEIARNKMKENTPVEIDRISSSANEVLNKMNAIIWSMNSGNDTVDNLASYIRSYAYEYFENTPIDCKVITPEHIPSKELGGDKRRNIFLCVKESLNNALKHSKASVLTITIETNDKLKIIIHDNGPGIDLQKLRQFGNGLKNITRRMESIGGSFTIENKNGTITTLELPL
ncbi:MAG: sensor histidine kinase [Chitinophagaceae bacterium]|nr:sensor histidine kinase [Chitinophagaceae bacterium]